MVTDSDWFVFGWDVGWLGPVPSRLVLSVFYPYKATNTFAFF